MEGRELEFPEIQQVHSWPAKKVTNSGESRCPALPEIGGHRQEGPSMAKKRFTRAAFRVLSQIVVNPGASPFGTGPDKEDDESKDSTSDAPRITVTDAEDDKQDRSQNDTPGDSQQKKPSVRLVIPQRPKFASLVRLAKFRRSIEWFHNESTAKSETPRPSCNAMPEENEVMPEKPRFCATLSPEAQYAMLKGYEDILLTELNEFKQKELNQQQQQQAKADQRRLLNRVKTPHRTVLALHLTDPANQEDVGADELGSHSFLHSPNDTVYTSTPIPLNQTPSYRNTQTQAPVAMHVQPRVIPPYYRSNTTGHALTLYNQNSTITPLSNNLHTNRSLDLVSGAAVPKEKQLRLTHKFHKAMDILDNIKVSHGFVPTSPRQGRRPVANPLDSYNTWSQSWAREFKFQFETQLGKKRKPVVAFKDRGNISI